MQLRFSRANRHAYWGALNPCGKERNYSTPAGAGMHRLRRHPVKELFIDDSRYCIRSEFKRYYAVQRTTFDPVLLLLLTEFLADFCTPKHSDSGWITFTEVVGPATPNPIASSMPCPNNNGSNGTNETHKTFSGRTHFAGFSNSSKKIGFRRCHTNKSVFTMIFQPSHPKDIFCPISPASLEAKFSNNQDE